VIPYQGSLNHPGVVRRVLRPRVGVDAAGNEIDVGSDVGQGVVLVPLLEAAPTLLLVVPEGLVVDHARAVVLQGYVESHRCHVVVNNANNNNTQSLTLVGLFSTLSGSRPPR
jgi:hypothetical protein